MPRSIERLPKSRICRVMPVRGWCRPNRRLGHISYSARLLVQCYVDVVMEEMISGEGIVFHHSRAVSRVCQGLLW